MPFQEYSTYTQPKFYYIDAHFAAFGQRYCLRQIEYHENFTLTKKLEPETMKSNKLQFTDG
jgi:hypothetical protein